jgi:gamma-glutamylcyclotransferase (GGCT)/AIG2-like uncharacterized protein YtfP
MPHVFSYGSLQQADVQQRTYGRQLRGASDSLPGFQVDRVRITDPARVAAAGRTHNANVVPSSSADSRVSGTVLEITDDELIRTDAYEAPDDYVRREVTLASGLTAWVYVYAPARGIDAVTPVPVSDRAAFYRAALWLGLVPGAEIVAWADELLTSAPDTPSAIVNLAAVPEHDVTGLRLALLRLGPEGPPWPVVQAVLGLAARQLTEGRRSFDDTCTVLQQARQWLPVPADVADELKQFELARLLDPQDDRMRDLEPKVRTWLGRYAGAEAAFVAS